jgi:hypothetical protein
VSEKGEKGGPLEVPLGLESDREMESLREYCFNGLKEGELNHLEKSLDHQMESLREYCFDGLKEGELNCSKSNQTNERWNC